MCGIKRQYFRIQYVKRSGSIGHKYKMFPVFVLNIVIGAATQKLVYEFKHIERSRLICRMQCMKYQRSGAAYGEQSYQDYLDGRSWLSSASDVKGTAKTTAAVEECPRDISRQAINLRGEADKAGVWETVQHGFPGMAVQIPYRRRMSDIGIDELNLSVRASNGLMRAGIDTLGKLNEMMKTDRGIAGIRNLGTKSVKEIGRAFLCMVYSMLSPYEKAQYWQRLIDKAQTNE